MVTIDLKDAYFHITIAPEHRKYLRFTLGKEHYQFKALPFGIASAPQVFTKFMVAIISHLHAQGISMFPYIDDWLLVADSVATLSSHLQLTLRSFPRNTSQLGQVNTRTFPTTAVYRNGPGLCSGLSIPTFRQGSKTMVYDFRSSTMPISHGHSNTTPIGTYEGFNPCGTLCKATHEGVTARFPKTVQTSLPL